MLLIKPPAWYSNSVRVQAYNLTNKSWWNTYKKAFVTDGRNTDFNAENMLEKGVYIARQDPTQTAQTFGFSGYTPGNFYEGPLNNSQLYARGRVIANNINNSPAAIVATQMIETLELPVLGQQLFLYQGILDEIRKSHPGINVRDTGLHGEYGQDSYGDDGLSFSPSVINQGLNEFIGLYCRLNPSTGTWDSVAEYFSNGEIDVRNVNLKLYLELTTDAGRVPVIYKMLLARERLKRATILQNKEREMCFYTWGRVQPVVRLNNGIENGNIGCIYNFPNGEYWNKDSREIEASADIMYDIALWSMILGRFYMWDSILYGSDVTKIAISNQGQSVYWRENTSSPFQDYFVGANARPGAPPNTNSGIGTPYRHYSTPQSASLAAQEIAWQVMPNFHTLELPQAVGGYTLPTGVQGRKLSQNGVANPDFFFGEYLFNYPLVVVGYKANGDLGGILVYSGYSSPFTSSSIAITLRNGTQVNGQALQNLSLTNIYGRRTVLFTY